MTSVAFKILKGRKMREIGIVCRLDGKGCHVRLDPRGGCKDCGLGAVCHASGTGKRELLLTDRPELNLKTGDEIEIETAPHGLLSAAFIVFMLPLLIAIGAYFIASRHHPGDSSGIAAFFIAFLLAEGLVFGLDRLFGRRSFFQPKIVRKIAQTGRNDKTSRSGQPSA
ncbi:MAG TPA: hypothetical protein ENN03_10180 [bacterium]|nr:hypothetical protein [bacterium]